ncbi:MAG: 16S rRNA processing protein RimM [Bacteroidaceae bacterium]|jgi:16S rRNA processing protein RimM|nr:16S rRNA processing protein RimM [Bacteroidaceae bacterium]MBQ5654776.1 16S rRNA processing protein RimM [Bacteroidaceae bacterium]
MIDTYKIGTLTRTHGIGGELSMNFTDDVWDRADADYVFLEVDGIQVPFFLEGWRFRSDSVALLKFQDIDSSESALEYVGADVYFPHDLTPEPSEDDEYTWRHFTGWKVVDDIAGEIGEIEHVEDSTANTIFFVGDKLIPATEDFIERIDAKERTIYMNLPEGLLDL